MSVFLNTPIEYLKGVGPSRAEILQKELDIFTFEDLLYHYPFRYIDRTKIYSISELNMDMPHIQIKGKILNYSESEGAKGKILRAKFADQTGTIDLIWFKRTKWIKEHYQPGTSYILFGKPGSFKGKLNIAHPEFEDGSSSLEGLSYQPVYPLTEKVRNVRIDNKTLRKLSTELFAHDNLSIPEILPKWVRDQEKLIKRDLAFKWIHSPSSASELEHAQNRLKFEEFFIMQAVVMKAKSKRKLRRGLAFPKVDRHFLQFYNTQLNFELTNAQKRVLKEIRQDMGSGKQMNRLLQGDVGSGKSIVALLSMLMAIDNGYQASIMAPTEILATQHFESFAPSLEALGLKAALLTGSTKKSERKIIHQGLVDGKIHILIGTHALIEDPVQLKNQGLVIIDEQHRFGVAQRARLWQKSTYYPHVLVMTATPIPRTLAMTIYGDLDVSKIDELPSGRKTIKTAVRHESNRLRVWGFVKEQIRAGRQVYMVYPLIEESAKLDYKNLEEGYEQALHYFPRPEFQIQMLHGRMKPEDKESAMNRFKNGEVQLLISTTVIEVGINVPNATVMVIESSEKFGLAQLHQLRGRVGRGAEQSYCILMAGPKLSKNARKRLNAMASTADGFEIAELDLKLRGPGDIEGTQQSGLAQLKLASIIHDEDILERSRNCVKILLDKDPSLELSEHKVLSEYLNSSKLYKDWGSIS